MPVEPVASESIEVPLDLVPSMPSVAISFDTDFESDAPAAKAEKPNESREESTSGIELSVDVDVGESEELAVASVTIDSAPSAAAPAPVATVANRSDFERRLRGNEPLTKTPRFDSHAPRDDRERSVLGLLQAGGRFSELMVLGRGVVAPAELIEALYTLCSAGVVRFEDPRAK